MSEAEIPTILISVDKAGHVNQCLAFCNLMAWPVGETFRLPGASKMQPLWTRRWTNLRGMAIAAAKAPRRRQFERLRVVASGVVAEDLARRYRDIYGADLFAVFVGSPKIQRPVFDFAIASHHALASGVPSGSLYPAAKRTLWIAGVLTRGVSAKPSQGNLAVALIGGLNKAFTIEPDQIAQQITAALAPEDTLAVIFSRRTPEAVEQRLRQFLTSANVRFVDRADRAGFEGAFAEAREFLVTPDSITMVCEACSTGKAVRLFSLPCFDPDTSTARFVREFLERGYVRAVDDAEDTIVPLPSLVTIGQEVGRAHEAWLSGQPTS